MDDTVPRLFLAFVDRDPEAIALRWHDGAAWRSLTRAELIPQVARGARALVDALGLRPGDAVAVLSETRREWSAVDLATLCVGGRTVGIYPTLTADQVRYQLAHSRARVCVVEDATQAAMVAAHRHALPHLRHVVSIDPVPGLRTLEALAGGADEAWLRARALEVLPEDVASIIYTSGTTGEPKGVVLTHANFVRTAYASKAIGALHKGETSLVFLPLAHSFQRFTGYRGFLEEGEGWYVRGVAGLPSAIRDARPAVLASVPRMLEKIRAKADATAARRGPRAQAIYRAAFHVGRERARRRMVGERVGVRLTMKAALADRVVLRKVRDGLGGHLRLIVSGGAPLHPDVAWWFLALGIPVLEGWGLTETSAPATANRADAYKVGTVGRPIDGTEVKIAPDGEVLVRGPGVFSGYLDDPASTAAAFDGEWFRTGDIGFLDEDGFLTLVDRKKELLVTAGGKNIAPAPLEARLAAAAVVEHAVALGDARPFIAALLTPDLEALDAMARSALWPDEPLAARLQRPEVAAAFHAAVTSANASAARHESIRRYVVLPRVLSSETGELTATFKLKRRVIAARFSEQIESLYAGGGVDASLSAPSTPAR